MAKGPTPGHALLALAAEQGAHPRLTSYTAKGWHAQLSKLTETGPGFTALRGAGVTVKVNTILRWLSDDQYPIRRSDREAIAQAYRARAGGKMPDDWRTKQFSIYGIVKMGDDERDRGNGCAPLRIAGSEGRWTRIESAFESGELDAKKLQDYFVEDVIAEDIGPGAEYMEFPGNSYTIT